MGYDIHIIKCKDYRSYLNKEFTPISMEEWHALIDNDPDLELRDKISFGNPLSGEEISISGDFGVFRYEEYEIPFLYRRGKISCSYGEECIEKAVEIANKLGAKVYGDEGEEYN